MVDNDGGWHVDTAASTVDQALHELVATVRAGEGDARVAAAARWVVDSLERRHQPVPAPPPAEAADVLRGLRAVEGRL